MSDFDTRLTPEKVDVIAPDGSEIRLLVGVDGGSMVHCTLPPGAVSLAVTHKTVGEVWYFLEGEGQVWRKLGDHETITEVTTGLSLSIPLGTHFQFRNTGKSPLCFIIVTMPPWPGEDEAQRVTDHWPTN